MRSEIEKIFADLYIANFLSIAILDLKTENAYVVKCSFSKNTEKKNIPWDKLIELYAEKRAFCNDKEKVCSLTIKYLKDTIENKDNIFPIEIRCMFEKDVYKWIQLNMIKLDDDRLLVTTKNVDDDRMLKKIVDMFVCNNFDYIILLDAKHNTYKMFSGGRQNVPIPEKRGDNYTKDMIEFNKKYVAQEDIERVTANMQIDNVVKMLEKNDIYSFTSSGVLENEKYRRSCIQFLYYDKSAELILISRTDVTQIYLEEQEKNTRLNAAMRAARHDPMTGIYNQKATAELVKQMIQKQYNYLAAVLFIDVDNFKMVNDTLGHQKGDELLCFLASSLEKIVGKSGIVGRIGGDEFLIFISAVENIEEIKMYSSKVCSVFDTIRTDILEKLPVTCSVGISLYPNDGVDYHTLVRKADQALYISKRYGKNRFFFYSKDK